MMVVIRRWQRKPHRTGNDFICAKKCRVKHSRAFCWLQSIASHRPCRSRIIHTARRQCADFLVATLMPQWQRKIKCIYLWRETKKRRNLFQMKTTDRHMYAWLTSAYCLVYLCNRSQWACRDRHIHFTSHFHFGVWRFRARICSSVILRKMLIRLSMLSVCWIFHATIALSLSVSICLNFFDLVSFATRKPVGKGFVTLQSQ